MDIELVTDPDACRMYIVSQLAGLGGGILWRPPAYSLSSFILIMLFVSLLLLMPVNRDYRYCELCECKF